MTKKTPSAAPCAGTHAAFMISVAVVTDVLTAYRNVAIDDFALSVTNWSHSKQVVKDDPR